MKKNILLPLTGFILLLNLFSCKTGGKAGEWQLLFNGKNLDGWSVKCSDGHMGFWSVEEGTLVASSLGSTTHDYNWLQSEGEYDDFELSFRFQVFPGAGGNAGLQFRSRWDPDARVPWNDSLVTGWLDGPQADINPPGAWRNGLIYDETRGHRRWISPSLENWVIDSATYAPEKVIQHEAPAWNRMVLTCKGTRVQVRVNDILVTDYNGSGILDDDIHAGHRVGMQGHIAFQIHRANEVHVRYKDIKIREL